MGILKERVIIITGATSGMGKAMAILFNQKGAKLVLSGRDEQRGKKLITELNEKNVQFIKGDISNPKTNEKLVNVALEKYGKLDTIVANAGMLGLGDVVSLSNDKWHETIDTNLSALFYLSKYA